MGIAPYVRSKAASNEYGGIQPSTFRSFSFEKRNGLKRASNRQGTRTLGSFPLPLKTSLLNRCAAFTNAIARAYGMTTRTPRVFERRSHSPE